MAVERTADRTSSRAQPIVSIRNLQTAFFTEKETVRAVDGIDLDIAPGETVGIVGESGSGKTVTARSIMGLVRSPGRLLAGSSIRFRDVETVREFAQRFPGRTVDLGAVDVDVPDGSSPARGDPSTASEGPENDERSLDDLVALGADAADIDGDDCVFITDGRPDAPETIEDGFIEITRLSGEPQRAMRGDKIGMVFQDPLTSLNPVYTVGNQIKEALRLHQNLRGAAATQEAVDLLEAVGIPDARRRLREYPHQFSGGMRQRAVIATALACDPEVLICDEPTTALDVTIQAQILELLADLQAERDLAIMFITHDMGVIADVSDRVYVMYAGEIVESAAVTPLFASPKHPYTQGLLRSIPGRQAGDRLETIPGDVPTPNQPPTSCRFESRCPKAFEACDQVHPVLVPTDGRDSEHTAACLLYPADAPRDDAVDYHAARKQRFTTGDGR